MFDIRGRGVICYPTANGKKATLHERNTTYNIIGIHVESILLFCESKKLLSLKLQSFYWTLAMKCFFLL